MQTKPFLLALSLLAPISLAGCNASRPNPTQPDPTVQQQRVGRIVMTPENFKLPEGSGCAGDVARYRAVMANDRDTGNVNDRVFQQISGEIDGAAAACSAGQDAQARSLIRASKARHGYPG